MENGRDRGEGGVEDRRTQDVESFRVQDHQGGAQSSTGKPPPCPPKFQLLPSSQVGWSKTSGAGASVCAKSEADNQALVGAFRRRATSES